MLMFRDEAGGKVFDSCLGNIKCKCGAFENSFVEEQRGHWYNAGTRACPSKGHISVPVEQSWEVTICPSFPRIVLVKAHLIGPMCVYRRRGLAIGSHCVFQTGLEFM